MLTLERLSVRYGRIQAVRDVDLEVNAGEIVALIGSNGAGKSTILRAISGLVPVAGGEIHLDGKRLGTAPSHRRVALGVAQVPEGRLVFGPLSVNENIRLGALRRGAAKFAQTLAFVHELFPVLKEHGAALAGTLSGGQQQMLAIARALAADPRLLLLDEPSMGISPLLTEQIFFAIRRLRDAGIAVLLVEQNAFIALGVADRGYVLQAGAIVHQGEASKLAADARIKAAYLGG